MVRPGRVVGLVLLVAALGVGTACSTPERVARPSATTAGGGATPTTSSTAPRQDATLEGRVVGPDGAPRRGASISVVRTNTGFRAGRVLEAVVTFGLSCVASPDDCPFRNEQVVDAAVTDANGRYALTLPGAYLPGYETDDDWIASVGRPPTAGEATGPSSRVELEVDAKVQSAPDLALWDGHPELTTTKAGQLLVSVPPLHGSASTDTVVRFATATGATVWTVHGSVDPRVLEDVPLRVLATGHDDVTVHHSEGRTIYHQDLNTAAVPYRGEDVPLSRNTSCTLEQTPSVGCPLTDGDLVTPTSHEAGKIATVDLGEVKLLELIVVRATDSTEHMTLEYSEEGARWRSERLGPLGGAPGAVATPSHIAARYLRVSSTTSGSIGEISAWPARFVPTEGFDQHPGRGWSTGRVLAAVLAALLAGAIGAVVVTRLRRSWPRGG